MIFKVLLLLAFICILDAAVIRNNPAVSCIYPVGCNFSDPFTWEGGVVPSSQDDVIIVNNATASQPNMVYILFYATGISYAVQSLLLDGAILACLYNPIPDPENINLAIGGLTLQNNATLRLGGGAVFGADAVNVSASQIALSGNQTSFFVFGALQDFSMMLDQNSSILASNMSLFQVQGSAPMYINGTIALDSAAGIDVLAPCLIAPSASLLQNFPSASLFQAAFQLYELILSPNTQLNMPWGVQVVSIQLMANASLSLYYSLNYADYEEQGTQVAFLDPSASLTLTLMANAQTIALHYDGHLIINSCAMPIFLNSFFPSNQSTLTLAGANEVEIDPSNQGNPNNTASVTVWLDRVYFVPGLNGSAPDTSLTVSNCTFVSSQGPNTIQGTVVSSGDPKGYLIFHGDIGINSTDKYCAQHMGGYVEVAGVLRCTTSMLFTAQEASSMFNLSGALLATSVSLTGMNLMPQGANRQIYANLISNEGVITLNPGIILGVDGHYTQMGGQLRAIGMLPNVTQYAMVVEGNMTVTNSSDSFLTFPLGIVFDTFDLVAGTATYNLVAYSNLISNLSAPFGSAPISNSSTPFSIGYSPVGIYVFQGSPPTTTASSGTTTTATSSAPLTTTTTSSTALPTTATTTATTFTTTASTGPTPNPGTTAFTSSTTTTFSTSSSTTTSGSVPGPDKKLSGGAKAAIALAVIFGVGGIVAAGVFYYLRRRRGGYNVVPTINDKDL